jgi:hypothetical protein
MTAKQATIQQPLLSNGSANKHVSMAIGLQQRNGAFYVVCAETGAFLHLNRNMLIPNHIRYQKKLLYQGNNYSIIFHPLLNYIQALMSALKHYLTPTLSNTYLR